MRMRVYNEKDRSKEFEVEGMTYEECLENAINGLGHNCNIIEDEESEK